MDMTPYQGAPQSIPTTIVRNQQFNFSSALFGNRLISLRIVLSSYTDNSFRATISSDNDHNLHHYTSLDPNTFCELGKILTKLSKSDEDHLRDTRVLCVRIEMDSTRRLHLVVESGSIIRPFPLQEHTIAEDNAHLRILLSKMKEQVDAEKRKNKTLIAEAKNTMDELVKLRQQTSWQTKELDLLKMLVRTPPAVFPSSSVQDRSHVHSESCNCGVERSDSPDGSDVVEEVTQDGDDDEDDVEEEEEEEQQEEDHQDEDDKKSTAHDSINTSFTPISSPGSSSMVANQSQDVLLGVAQYILCQLCPQQTADLKVMQDHFLSNHVDQEKRHCSACPSDSNTDLMQHMKQHTNRIYACEFCGKRGRKHFLKAHIRTHTGEKPFSCETCGRGFADASTLRRHRLVHSGEKKHVCPICGRGIARKDNVKAHIKSHTVL